jgi:hypothetical protein
LSRGGRAASGSELSERHGGGGLLKLSLNLVFRSKFTEMRERGQVPARKN